MPDTGAERCIAGNRCMIGAESFRGPPGLPVGREIIEGGSLFYWQGVSITLSVAAEYLRHV